MYSERALGDRHAFDWVCESCSLDPLCLQRRLFEHAAELPGHVPIPTTGAIPERLMRWTLRHENGAAMLRRVRRRSASGQMLRELLRLAPADGLLAGTGVRWMPLENGRVELRSGEWRCKLRIGPENPSWKPQWRAGHYAIGPYHDCSPLDCESPGVKALADVLGSLPAPTVVEPVEVKDESGAGSSTEASASALRVGDSLGARDGAAWEGFWRGVFLERFARVARRQGLDVRVEGVTGVGVTLREGGGARARWIRVAPRSGPTEQGFLCGRVRVMAGPEDVVSASAWYAALLGAMEGNRGAASLARLASGKR